MSHYENLRSCRVSKTLGKGQFTLGKEFFYRQKLCPQRDVCRESCLQLTTHVCRRPRWLSAKLHTRPTGDGDGDGGVCREPDDRLSANLKLCRVPGQWITA